ncbi:MAG: hypothetical protein ACI3YG_10135 [Prevotella sp.]
MTLARMYVFVAANVEQVFRFRLRPAFHEAVLGSAWQACAQDNVWRFLADKRVMPCLQGLL